MTDPGVAEKEFWAVGGLLEAYPEHPESSSTAGLLDADPHSKRGRSAASVYTYIGAMCQARSGPPQVAAGGGRRRRGQPIDILDVDLGCRDTLGSGLYDHSHPHKDRRGHPARWIWVRPGGRLDGSNRGGSRRGGGGDG